MLKWHMLFGNCLSWMWYIAQRLPRRLPRRLWSRRKTHIAPVARSPSVARISALARAPAGDDAPGANRANGGDGANGDDSGHEDAWRAFSSWAEAQIPRDTGLRWWETAAGAASSLLVFALIAAAAEPTVRERDTAAIELAYFPWIGALHLLLDSLVDHASDISAGRHSLIEHYGSPRELAGRLGTISAGAVRAARALPRSEQHELILAAMASFYLTQPAASSPAGALAGAEILAALGARAVPTMWLLRARRWHRAR